MAAAGLQANEAWPAVANHFGSLTVGDFCLQKKMTNHVTCCIF